MGKNKSTMSELGYSQCKSIVRQNIDFEHKQLTNMVNQIKYRAGKECSLEDLAIFYNLLQRINYILQNKLK